MKNKALVGMMVAALLIASATVAAIAQNGPGKGCGYSGPPKSDAERAARQSACLEKNGGVCPNGGPRANCPGYGQGGQGKGNGKCARQGLRDGTGPRGANGTCPKTPANRKQ